MDAAASGTAANAAAIAGEAAAQTAAVVAAVENSAAAAIEHAEQRVEAAQAVAEQITDAAFATALGEKISKVEQEAIKWQGETGQKIATLEATAAELRNLITGVSAQITDLLAKQLTPQPPAAEAIPPSATVETTMPATETPAENAEAILEESGDRAKAVRRRFWK